MRMRAPCCIGNEPRDHAHICTRCVTSGPVSFAIDLVKTSSDKLLARVVSILNLIFFNDQA